MEQPLGRHNTRSLSQDARPRLSPALLACRACSPSPSFLSTKAESPDRLTRIERRPRAGLRADLTCSADNPPTTAHFALHACRGVWPEPCLPFYHQHHHRRRTHRIHNTAQHRRHRPAPFQAPSDTLASWRIRLVDNAPRRSSCAAGSSSHWPTSPRIERQHASWAS